METGVQKWGNSLALRIPGFLTIRMGPGSNLKLDIGFNVVYWAERRA